MININRDFNTAWVELLHKSQLKNEYIFLKNDGSLILDQKQLLLTDKTVQKINFSKVLDYTNKLSLQALSREETLLVVSSLQQKVQKIESRNFSGWRVLFKFGEILSNGFLRRGFQTTSTRTHNIIHQFLHHYRQLIQDPSASLRIIQYHKTVQKTKDLIPTKKKKLEEGACGAVYEHGVAFAPALLVKKIKWIGQRALLQEPQLPLKLDHPNIIKIVALYIKKKSNAATNNIHSYKYVIHKAAGIVMRDAVIAEKDIEKLIFQTMSACIYLFNKGFAWVDLNGGNQFFDRNKGITFIDLDFWESVKNSKERAKSLLTGAYLVVANIVEQASLKDHAVTEIEALKENFGKTDILINDEEIQTYIIDYFNAVIEVVNRSNYNLQ